MVFLTFNSIPIHRRFSDPVLESQNTNRWYQLLARRTRARTRSTSMRCGCSTLLQSSNRLAARLGCLMSVKNINTTSWSCSYHANMRIVCCSCSLRCKKKILSPHHGCLFHNRPSHSDRPPGQSVSCGRPVRPAGQRASTTPGSTAAHSVHTVCCAVWQCAVWQCAVLCRYGCTVAL
jgi:hypothetical protein